MTREQQIKALITTLKRQISPSEAYRAIALRQLERVNESAPAELGPKSAIAGMRMVTVDGVTVTEYELTSAAKKALAVNATLPVVKDCGESVALLLTPGRFYVSKAGDTWCCYKHCPDELEHLRASCVNVDTGRTDVFYEDGRCCCRDSRTLVSEHPYRPEEL